MKYKENSRWYVDAAVMYPDKIQEFKDKIYTDKFINDNLTLKKHHNKYRDDDFAPCWKVFEYLSFGSILSIFGAIQDDSAKQIIADKYEVKSLSKFFKLIHVVRLIRNICAHSGVLFDYSLPRSVSSIPQITYNQGDRNSLDASMKVIGFFLQNISENRYNDYNFEVKTLFDKGLADPKMSLIIRERIKYLD
jgi:abortive infection bacteriophage resistance protein